MSNWLVERTSSLGDRHLGHRPQAGSNLAVHTCARGRQGGSSERQPGPTTTWSRAATTSRSVPEPARSPSEPDSIAAGALGELTGSDATPRSAPRDLPVDPTAPSTTPSCARDAIAATRVSGLSDPYRSRWRSGHRCGRAAYWPARLEPIAGHADGRTLPRSWSICWRRESVAPTRAHNASRTAALGQLGFLSRSGWCTPSHPGWSRTACSWAVRSRAAASESSAPGTWSGTPRPSIPAGPPPTSCYGPTRTASAGRVPPIGCS